jgi:hypothetical protein
LDGLYHFCVGKCLAFFIKDQTVKLFSRNVRDL